VRQAQSPTMMCCMAIQDFQAQRKWMDGSPGSRKSATRG